MKKIICASIIALGLAALGFFIQLGMLKQTQAQRTVSVKGLSEREVLADKVTWPLYFKEVGDNLQQLYSQIQAKNNAIVSFLKQRGLTEEEISISAPLLVDLKANIYGSENTKARYNITSVITVNSLQVNLVRELMSEQSELLKQGIALSGGDYAYQTTYEFTGLSNIKPKMIEEATANARETALKFAKDSHSRLGKIKRAYQGQFSIEDRDMNTPYIKKVRVVTSVDYYLSK